MKKLERNLDNTFPVGFKGKNAFNKHFKLLELKRSALANDEKLKIKSNWSKAKINLIKESRSKCAYCESYFTTVSYGDVEHFRPKSIYWWLAYAYFNYTAACVICNQQFKKALFEVRNSPQKIRISKTSSTVSLRKKAKEICPDPTSPDYVQQYTKFRKKHFDERPLLLDPYFDDPVDYFKYVIRDDTREVWIDTLYNNNQKKSEIVFYTIRTLGLDRDDLNKNRYNVLERYRIFRELYSTIDIDPRYKKLAEIGLRQLLSQDAEYAAMIDYFNKKSLEEIRLPL